MVLTPRTELGAEPQSGDGEVIASLMHFSDLHVMDAASPMRFEWIETLAHDPRWHPLLHMHRPQESLVPWALEAHVRAVRDQPNGATRGRPLDLVLFTGDNIDNAQGNELDAYLALVAGGTSTLSPIGGPQDAGEAPAGTVWPYWSPRPDVADTWKARGYPVVDDLLQRAAQPLDSAGLGVPWASLPGNHDVMCQGTSLINDALNAAAVGSTKALFPPAGFQPDDPGALFVDAPELFLGAGGRTIEPVADRRAISMRDWIERHVRGGAVGLSQHHIDTESTDTVIHLHGVSVITLDTNHPAGDYQGSVGIEQLAWLDDELASADADGRVVVLASHHNVDTLVNTRGHDPSRVLAPPMLDVIHRHPCVVASLVGHRHINRVTPRPGAAGGYWEITTASIIDWPVERRSIEIVRHANGTIELVCTMQAHGAPDESLAGIHRTVAQRFGGSQLRSGMAGADVDRDVRLFVAR
jgi:metallophosphoesterase (TIGR03767 family)